MRIELRGALGVVLTLAVLELVAVSPSASASPAQSSVVSAVPVATTPNVADGAVLAIAAVGNRVILGGNFTAASPPTPRPPIATAPHPWLLSFDPTTGTIDDSFAPVLDGAVNALLPGPVAGTVYVAGDFEQVNGAARRGVVLLNLSNGATVTSFASPLLDTGTGLGTVTDIAVSAGRLFLAGTFTTVNGVAHAGLATLNATSGSPDNYLSVQVAGHHNWIPGSGRAYAAVGVSRIDISPDGSRLVAIGNFKTASGLLNDQVAMIDLNSTSAVLDPAWRTTRYSAACSYSFDSYVRDVDFSPDGAYFVIAASGGPGHFGSLCDAAARFPTAPSGAYVRETWAAFTGGDTLLSVAVTGPAVYVGGHQRWLNNARGSDVAAAGAVPRPGLAALDPLTGVPLAWNPGRDPRGVGTAALLATPTGLWVGSDTQYIGPHRYYRGEIAFFPLAGGSPPADTTTGGLPGTVYLAGTLAGGDGVRTHAFDGTAAGSAATGADGGIAWNTVRGTVMIAGRLYYGLTDGTFYRRTFDGTTYGTQETLDPYNDPVWNNVLTGSGPVGQTYRGMVSGFFAEIPGLTSLFFWDGRLYYTRTGQSGLFYRYFSPDSGVVGDTEFTASGGITWTDTQGAFLAGANLYYATRTDGLLHRMRFAGGQPVPGTSVVVGGANDWRAPGMFLYAAAGASPNKPPSAALSAHCAGRTCSVSGTASTDPDGTISTYSWNFGDGATATGATTSHTYSGTGVHPITLKVTDSGGATDITGRTLPAIPVADFNGDGFSDLTVFRPSTGIWYSRGISATAFGKSGDRPAPGDYNGDGTTEEAVFRPSNGTWYVQGSSPIAWGLGTDLPVPGDYNGDGRTDLALFRPSTGTWYVRGGSATAFGQTGDKPVPGDYNGDGTTDLAVFRPSGGTWYVRGGSATAWGLGTDVLVPGDYNGDGRTDLAVFRPSTGTWYVRGIANLPYGASGDIPAALDFDADGRTDISVWRPSNGTWYRREFSAVQWGSNGDIPIRQ